MDKRWYPVAFSVTMVACGGDVDNGKPVPPYGPHPFGGTASTGGVPSAHYGPVYVAGGATGIDTGLPNRVTGGNVSVALYGAMAPSGGNANGGTSAIDTGTPSQAGTSVIMIYMANLRLRRACDIDKPDSDFALPFHPRPKVPMDQG